MRGSIAGGTSVFVPKGKARRSVAGKGMMGAGPVQGSRYTLSGTGKLSSLLKPYTVVIAISTH